MKLTWQKTRTLPDKERSSWQRAKSQTLTVVSSEQEQNFKSVLQKLLNKTRFKIKGNARNSFFTFISSYYSIREKKN